MSREEMPRCLYLYSSTGSISSRCRLDKDPMLNPVLKSVHFLDYLNFGQSLIFSLVHESELVQLSIGYMPVNIELVKFV